MTTNTDRRYRVDFRAILSMGITLILLLGVSSSFAQQYEDVVHLKNGEIRRGIIVEEIPFKQIKIMTKDGNVFVYNYDDIEKKTKEQPLNPQPILNDPYSITSPRSERKNPGMALALSAIPGFFGLCGGGQVYNEQVGKGVLYFATGLISMSWAYSEKDSNPRPPAVIFLSTYIIGMVDAYSTAKTINRRFTFDSSPSSSRISFGATPIGEKSFGLKAITRF